MRAEIILNKAIGLEPITLEEGMFIYENFTIKELMLVFHRKTEINLAHYSGDIPERLRN